MYCRHCGRECPPEALYCPSCGRPVDPEGGLPPAPADSSLSSTIQNYLVLAIFSTALCCMPFGVPAIVFAVQARTRNQMGDLDGAQDSLSKARMWSWLSFGAGALVLLGYLGLILVGAVSEL